MCLFRDTQGMFKIFDSSNESKTQLLGSFLTIDVTLAVEGGKALYIA